MVSDGRGTQEGRRQMQTYIVEKTWPTGGSVWGGRAISAATAAHFALQLNILYNRLGLWYCTAMVVFGFIHFILKIFRVSITRTLHAFDGAMRQCAKPH